jgi:hypothetical protein
MHISCIHLNTHQLLTQIFANKTFSCFAYHFLQKTTTEKNTLIINSIIKISIKQKQKIINLSWFMFSRSKKNLYKNQGISMSKKIAQTLQIRKQKKTKTSIKYYNSQNIEKITIYTVLCILCFFFIRSSQIFFILTSKTEKKT